MEPFSHSMLGKALAILLIAGYAAYDVIYGLLFCFLVILYYYTTDAVLEGFLYEYQLDAGKTDDFYKLPAGASTYAPYVDSPLEKPRDELAANFVNQNCPNGNLTKHNTKLGDYSVPTEMAGHIYPELAYPGPPCNPCSSQCAFKIVADRLVAEEDIVHPKSSNEWFETITTRLSSAP